MYTNETNIEIWISTILHRYMQHVPRVSSLLPPSLLADTTLSPYPNHTLFTSIDFPLYTYIPNFCHPTPTSPNPTTHTTTSQHTKHHITPSITSHHSTPPLNTSQHSHHPLHTINYIPTRTHTHTLIYTQTYTIHTHTHTHIHT